MRKYVLSSSVRRYRYVRRIDIDNLKVYIMSCLYLYLYMHPLSFDLHYLHLFAFLSLRLEGEETLKYRCVYCVCWSVGISVIRLLKNNLTNIFSKISKIGMDL